MNDKFRKTAARGEQPFRSGAVSAIEREQVWRDRMKLLEQGYSPIPNYDKTTFLKGWPSVEVTPELVDEWSRRHGRWLATGLRIERGLVAVDLDVDDAAMVEQLADLMMDAAPVLEAQDVPWLERSSGRAKVAWFFRTDELFGRLHTRRWLRPGETAEKDATQFVEIFGGGSSRQFGCFGAHTLADNGEVLREYAWRDLSPLDVSLDELPIITKKQLAAFCDAAERAFEVAGWTAVPLSTRGENAGERIYDISDDATFDCLDDVSRTLDEMRERASIDDDLRCSASFFEGASAKNRTRCLVRLERGRVAIWDTATTAHHLEASAKPRSVEDAIDELRSKFVALAGRTSHDR